MRLFAGAILLGALGLCYLAPSHESRDVAGRIAAKVKEWQGEAMTESAYCRDFAVHGGRNGGECK